MNVWVCVWVHECECLFNKELQTKRQKKDSEIQTSLQTFDIFMQLKISLSVTVFVTRCACVCVSLGVCANCNKCFIWPQQLQIKTKNNATRDVRNEQQKHDNNNNSCSYSNNKQQQQQQCIPLCVSYCFSLCIVWKMAQHKQQQKTKSENITYT